MLRAPVVVLGASGMIGRAAVQALEKAGVPHVALTHAECDLSAFDAGVIPSNARTIINCAAWTNVDGAESNEADATRINGHAVGELAAHARRIGAVLVHYSTDYVFSGDSTAPYAVDHPRAPINAYGRSKAVGEELLERSGAEYLLLRTSWVYAPWGKNFVRTIVGLSRERPKLRVVNDQRGRPSSAEEIARVSLGLCAAGARGTFHVTDAGECTWFELARAAVQGAGAAAPGGAAPAVVEPCTSSEFPSPARRPSYSVLDLSRTIEQVGPLVPWQQSLSRVLPRLEPR